MIGGKVHGLPELKAALAGIVPKLRVRVLRNSLAAGARLVQSAQRAKAPVISASALAVKKGYRKPGTLKSAISVRTSKRDRRAGDVGVFVNVKPSRRGNRGAKNPNDPFYWPWVEWGHRIVARFAGKYTDYKIRGRGRLTGIAKRRRASTGWVIGRRFITAGVAQLPAALDAFVRKIGPAIAKLNKPNAPAP